MRAGFSGGGFATPARAWLREVSISLPRCLRENAEPIDVALARQQHAAYAAALAEAGVTLEHLAADDACPDCVYIEDTAVLLGPRVLLTNPGAASRRPELEPVAAALSAQMPVHRMRSPATLDGGDVLRVGEWLFVGLSGRTNPEGLQELATLAGPLGLTVLPVPVAAGLHLKSAITLASPELLVLVRGQLDPGAFEGHGLELLQVEEPLGGNVLALADRVLVSAGAPRLAENLAARGLNVVSVNVSELHKGDGALTCLSLRQPPEGRWCA